MQDSEKNFAKKRIIKRLEFSIANSVDLIKSIAK